MIVTERVKKLAEPSIVQHYEWLYARPPYERVERFLVHREEHYKQVQEQRKARDEIRALKAAR